MIVHKTEEGRQKEAEPRREEAIYPILYGRLFSATRDCLNYSGKDLGKRDVELLGANKEALSLADPRFGVELKRELDEQAAEMEPKERLQFACSLAKVMPRIKSDLYREIVRKVVVSAVQAEAYRLSASTSSDVHYPLALGKLGDVLLNLSEREAGRLCKERAERKRSVFFPISEQDVREMGVHKVETSYYLGKDGVSLAAAAKCLSQLVSTEMKGDDGKVSAKLQIYPLSQKWYDMLGQVTQLVNDLKVTKHYKPYFTAGVDKMPGHHGGRAKAFEKLYMLSSWKEAEGYKLQPLTGEQANSCFSDWLRHNVYKREAFIAEGKVVWKGLQQGEKAHFARLFEAVALAGQRGASNYQADHEVSDFFLDRKNQEKFGFNPDEKGGRFKFFEMPEATRAAILEEFFPRLWARFRMGEFDGSWRQAEGATPNISPLAVACLAMAEDGKTANWRIHQSRGVPHGVNPEYLSYFRRIMQERGWAG